MTPPTPAIDLLWQIASAEAWNSQQEYIEPSHFFIALCRLPEIAASRRFSQIGLDELERSHVLAECNCLAGRFAQARVDPVKLRRELRTNSGLGSAARAERHEEVVHRSARSKRVFALANRLASNDGQPMSAIHLLAALVSPVGGDLGTLLKSRGVDVAALTGTTDAAASADDCNVQDGRPGSESILSHYGRDLTQLAREGKLDPVVGRKEEMLRVVQTLSRATKNNALLIGEPGVGKTAVVEGLASRIVLGNVVEAIQNKRIIQIDVATLIEGSKYRGEFEARARALLSEMASSPDVILFIDEIHTIVRAGAVEGGALDAANIFKPALARGELRCIGATTIDEFRSYFEKDPALERRFQPIQVEEPSIEDSILILKGSLSRFRDKHDLTIPDETVNAAVQLSARYIRDRYLPDKAIDVLDEACAQVSIRGLTLGANNAESEGGTVRPADIAAVVTKWTGIPVADPAGDERAKLLEMESHLKRRVVGQDEGVAAVAQVMRNARTGLRDPRRPLGVMLFRGPTGVGKTELAKALAEFLFGSENAMLRLDMSEFKEQHSVSRLIGAPPGYVRSDEEGQLTGPLRRRPFSVVLFDEVEKAHPQILDLLLQLFEDGRLTDSHGKTVDGTNALFIMTSNVGAAASHALGFRSYEESAGDRYIPRDLRATFRPEFINRIDCDVEFRPLAPEHVRLIATYMLDTLGERAAVQGIRLNYTDAALALLGRLGFDPDFGARPLRRLINDNVSSLLSTYMLRGDIKAGDSITIDSDGQDLILRRWASDDSARSACT